MNITKKQTNLIASLATFLIAFIVFYFSAERTGSLWDCGEFILGAHKMQVVHPPGAPFFMLAGRMFAVLGSVFGSELSDIAFMVNLSSGLVTALAAMFICKITMIVARIIMEKNPSLQNTSELAIGASGLVAGLSTAFSVSIWFSAVEGEVYAMSTFFTALTVWSAFRWYVDKSDQADRWLILSIFSIALSLGVHLLSLLTLPALALLYYLKNEENPKFTKALLYIAGGAFVIFFVQKFIIAGIPAMWQFFEIPMVNSMGLPVHSGLVPTLAIVAASIAAVLYYANKKNSKNLQLIGVSLFMLVIGFSTIGVIVLRANADTPLNMNVPSDATRLLPYLNREQYGERPLLFGPHFDAQPVDVKKTPRYGLVGDEYEIVEDKFEYEYKSSDEMFFPRISHSDGLRKKLYREYWGEPSKRPDQAFNFKFFFGYQLNFMYWRYFMWNFAGKQNAQQGTMPYRLNAGQWISGVTPLDEARLYNMSEITDTMKSHRGTNKYYFIPLLLGLLGLFFHLAKSKEDFLVLLVLFLITGIGIIIYSNQPPQEPRERDYVLAGSFMTFCIWIGLGVMALSSVLMQRLKLGSMPAGALAAIIGLSAPVLMGTQNFDDMSRNHITAARDYASNFLESCEPNAIIFTYGDNDTYPLWYAQEVEDIRRDVRVVNLSLIQVDWYINKLRSKMNDSPPIKLTIPPEEYRGSKRNQVFFYSPNDGDLNRPVNALQELKSVGNPKNNVNGQTIMRSKVLRVPIDVQKAKAIGMIQPQDTSYLPYVEINLSNRGNYIVKDELAMIDLITSNINDRPIYYSTTCRNEKLMNLNDFTQLEGLGLRIIPTKTASDKSLSIYGSGRADGDLIHDRIINKWRFGGFDKRELFVDESYAAGVQAQKYIFHRGIEQLISERKLDKAEQLTDKYFEAFPHMNFPFDLQTTTFIDFYRQIGREDKAKPHIETIVHEVKQNMEFYDSIDPEILKGSFQQDYSISMSTIYRLYQLSQNIKDPELKKLIEENLGVYQERLFKN